MNEETRPVQSTSLGAGVPSSLVTSFRTPIFRRVQTLMQQNLWVKFLHCATHSLYGARLITRIGYLQQSVKFARTEFKYLHIFLLSSSVMSSSFEQNCNWNHERFWYFLQPFNKPCRVRSKRLESSRETFRLSAFHKVYISKIHFDWPNSSLYTKFQPALY